MEKIVFNNDFILTSTESNSLYINDIYNDVIDESYIEQLILCLGKLNPYNELNIYIKGGLNAAVGTYLAVASKNASNLKLNIDSKLNESLSVFEHINEQLGSIEIIEFDQSLVFG